MDFSIKTEAGKRYVLTFDVNVVRSLANTLALTIYTEDKTTNVSSGTYQFPTSGTGSKIVFVAKTDTTVLRFFN